MNEHEDFLRDVRLSKEKPSYTPSDAGCYVDGARGIYSTDAIVDFARDHGAVILQCDYSSACGGDHADTCFDSEFAGCEFANEIENEASDYMNETYPVAGHYWGRTISGDWGLWPLEDD